MLNYVVALHLVSFCHIGDNEILKRLQTRNMRRSFAGCGMVMKICIHPKLACDLTWQVSSHMWMMLDGLVTCISEIMTHMDQTVVLSNLLAVNGLPRLNIIVQVYAILKVMVAWVLDPNLTCENDLIKHQEAP
ncbi:hypothetical protein L1887_22067 [Cichorium endivia]|nr:hypothetical protein L1887_22067 [Cichorium endivia]